MFVHLPVRLLSVCLSVCLSVDFFLICNKIILFLRRFYASRFKKTIAGHIPDDPTVSDLHDEEDAEDDAINYEEEDELNDEEDEDCDEEYEVESETEEEEENQENAEFVILLLG